MVSNNLIIGIQCRLSSKRLPAKALLSFSNTTILGMLIKRAKLWDYPVYVLTSNLKEDNLVEKEALACGADGIIRGDLNDVRSRYQKLSKIKNAEYLVRVTADNPLTDFSLINQIYTHMIENDLEYCTCDNNYCIEGTNLEIFTKNILDFSINNFKFDSDKEHVTLSILKNTIHPYIKNLGSRFLPENYLEISFTIDNLSDYVKLKNLIEYAIKKGNDYKNKDFLNKCLSILKCSNYFYPKGRNHLINE